MTKIDQKQVGLIKTLGTALSAVGAVCSQIAEAYDVTIPATLAASTKPAKAEPTSKPAKTRKRKAGTRLLKTPERKANDADYAAAIAKRKATKKMDWPEVRDALCIELGLTRRQVNGILAASADDGVKQLPKTQIRDANDLDRAAVIKLRKHSSEKDWPAARDRLCIERGLTRYQVGGIAGSDFKRKHGILMGRPKKKVSGRK